jgi:predicted AAA+ superfamily ATPase
MLLYGTIMKKILVEQNQHWSNVRQQFVKREKLKQLIDYLPLKQIITITGIRRCGKSTLAKDAIEYLIDNGTQPENIFFVNLEQPYFIEHRHNASYLNIIYEQYLKLMAPKGKIYIIFDEIQFFDNWQVYIKSKYETGNIKFIITGSNSSILSNDLNTLLSGRSLNIHLDTFSFTEFLEYKNISYTSDYNRINNKIDIKRAMDEYLKWGGFFEVFEVANETIKQDILIAYAKNIIYQDIVPRYKIRNSEILERLFFYLLSNVTGILNYTTLAHTFGVSDKSIKEYINYFEDVFLLKRLDKFHNKPKERIKSIKKIYVLDNGFLQIAPKFSKNLGTSIENLVFNVLRNPKLLTGQEVYYLKDTYEIDFFSNNKLIQVSYDISDEKTKKRELNAFKHFTLNGETEYKLVTYNTIAVINEVDVVSIDDFILDLLNS